MAPLLHTVSLGSAAAASALFSAIWEGAVLAGCVLICMRLLPGLSAAARSAIWMNVFALLVLLHLLPSFSGHWAQANPAGNPAQPSLLHLDPRWSLGLAGAWAVLSLFRAAQLISSAIRLHRLASRATPVCVDAALGALLEQTEAGKRMRRPAELCTSTEVERPSVFGFFRPRILIPPDLMEKLSPQELKQVLLHEMEHLRRADDWSNLVQKVGLMLFPLNPVLLWVERRLCAERELACDDRVLRLSAGRKAYAICLTRLAEYSILHRGLSLVLGAWERQPELVRRVHRILRRPARSMSGKPAMFASAGLILGALGCAIALSRSPQLVSFAPRAQSAVQAHSLPPPAIRPMNPGEMGGAPRLVKAVMTQKPHQSRNRLRRLNSIAAKPNAMRDPVHSPQEWLVLTDWQDTELPPRLVIAVDRETRSSYAAVRLANGWLIVQI